MSNANTIETPTNRNDAALHFYSDLSKLLHDIGSSRIMHIVLTQGNLSFLHQATRYNAAPGDYIILPNAALAQDFAASNDFKALLFSLSPSIGNRLALRSNYGIIGHLSLLQNPVMRLAEEDFMRCRTDIERLYERWLATGHYFHEEMVGHLLAAHILDLYDIHARNCLPENFPTRAAELLRRFTEELASGQLSPLPKSGLVRRKAMRHAALPLGNLSASKRTQRRLLHRPLYASGDCETARRQTTLCCANCRRAFVFFSVLLYEIRQETLRHVAQGLSQCRIQLNRFASAAAGLTF